MIAESKLTFAAWTGLGITAASIGTVVYQKLGGFGISNKENPGTGNNLIKKLTEDNQENKEEDEKSLKTKPEEDSKVSKKDTQAKSKEDLEAPKTEKENKDESLDQKNNQEEDQSSDTDEIKHFSLGWNEEDELEEVAKK